MKRAKTLLVHRETTEAEIQNAAYLLWVEEGHPEGRDRDRRQQAKGVHDWRHVRDASPNPHAMEISAPVLTTGDAFN